MSVKDYMKFVIFRVAAKGLEVFLVKNDHDDWVLPFGDAELDLDRLKDDSCIIDLNQEPESKIAQNAKAIEADYHDIPSLRALIKEDLSEVKDRIGEALPDMENGSFMKVKDALKKALPTEYKALKELKDIIIDRNQILNL